MSPATWRTRHRLLRAVQVVVALVAVLVVVAAALHLPVVRRALLRAAVGQLERRFEIVLRAESLGYNLATRRVNLAGVTVAAAHDPQTPFLSARRVDLALPWGALRGSLAFDEIRFDEARVTVVQRRDGTANLPRSRNGAGGDPGAVAIGRLVVPRLGVFISNEPAGLSIAIPALSVDLGPESGTMALQGSARIRFGDVAETLTTAAGGAAFDGRRLRLTGVRAATADTTVTVDGTIALLVAEPGVDLRFSGDGDVRSLARWATSMPPLDGRLAFEGTLDGPFSQPSIRGRARSASLSRPGLTLGGVEATFALDANGIAASVDAHVAAGRTRLTVAQPAADADLEVALSWTDLDAATLWRAYDRRLTPRPAARISGNARARGRGADLAAWTVDAAATLRRSAGGGGRDCSHGCTAAARRRRPVAAGERPRCRCHSVADPGWRAARPNRIAHSTLQGRLTMPAASLDDLVTTLTTAGLIADPIEGPMAGSLEVAMTLSGTLDDPPFSSMPARPDWRSIAWTRSTPTFTPLGLGRGSPPTRGCAAVSTRSMPGRRCSRGPGRSSCRSRAGFRPRKRWRPGSRSAARS